MKKQISIIINTRNRKAMLFDLIKSIYNCHLDFVKEIIVIDDCSDMDYFKELNSKFPKIIFIRNTVRKFIIKSRNVGWGKAKGNIIFFIDDDNVIKDRDFFNKAHRILEKDRKIAVLGARSYYFDYPNKILVGQAQFNCLTGKTTFVGINEDDHGQFDGLLKTFDNPNAFFTYKRLLEDLKGFPEEMIQTFHDADFCEQLRRKKLSVVQSSELKVYHKSPLVNFKKITPRLMGGSPERFYYLMRNRFVFIKKYGSLLDKVVFSIFFSHLYTLYYLVYLIKYREWEMVTQGLRAVADGYIYMLTGKLNNYYNSIY